MVKVKVVDSIMGSGKTSWAIQFMNENPGRPFIYITPYNEEVERIKRECPGLQFYSGEEGQKFKDFKRFLRDGKNIVATHKCFEMADDEVRALLEAHNYTLIMDEVFNVVEDVKITKKDMETIQLRHARVENDILVWTDDDYPEDGVFGKIMRMARTKGLMVFQDTFLLWLFPAEIFRHFREVYVLTYLFGGQIQRHYFDLHNISYDYYQVAEVAVIDGKSIYELMPYGSVIEQKPSADIIDIYDGPMNEIGREEYDLSFSWFDKKKNEPKIPVLKANINNFLRNLQKAKSEEIMWTCYGKNREELKGDGYSRGFVECNARATNKYRQKTNIAYVINRFMRPVISNYFANNSIVVDQEGYALTDMLQFVWRSAIREGQKINIYVPSKRMRNLLENWLTK